MKFIVEKTSMSSRDDYSRPCEEAKEKITVYNSLSRENQDIWLIDINSLDELMTFVNKYEKVVIGKDYITICYYCDFDEKLIENLPVIEIYDDYRE